MAEQNIAQIIQAFNSIESKLQEQSRTLKELTSKVASLENQNKQLVQLVHQLRGPDTQSDPNKNEFQQTVTKSLRSIEDKSKKTMELIKANSAKEKKRAWP